MEYRTWLAEQRRRGKGEASGKAAAGLAAEAAAGPVSVPVSAVDVAEIERQLAEPTGTVEDLHEMRGRLQQAELAAHRQYLKIRLEGAAGGEFLEVWQSLCEARRRVEKDLPEILHRRGRYVDVHEVGRIVTEAVTGMAAELDQVGISIAELCVGKTAREIRLAIDDRIRTARGRVAVAWQQIIGDGAAAGRAENRETDTLSLERTDHVGTNGEES
jgi:hypothetical protein